MSGRHLRQQRVTQARERADRARLRFNAALQSTRQRLTPDHLKADARDMAIAKVNEAKRSLRKSIRTHPVLAVLTALGGLALMFWAPARHLALFGARASQLIWLNWNLWTSK